MWLLLIEPYPVQGWGNTWMGAGLETIVNTARWKVGPLRYGAALRLDNVGYDSDIYFGMTTGRVPDYTMNAGIPFRVFLPIKKKVVFDISDNPQYLFYAKTNKERALNNDFSGQVHIILDRVYFQAGGRYVNARERLSPELTINARRKESTLAGLVLWQLSKGASIALQHRSSAYHFENPTDVTLDIGQNLNRKESFFNFTAYLQQASKTRFFLDGEYGAYTFSESLSRFKDSRSYVIYGGAEFLPAAEGQGLAGRIQGRINLGFKHFDVLDPQGKDYSGLVGNSSVSVGILKKTSITGIFFRDIQFSAYSSLSYYLITSYGGGLTQLLSRRSRLEYDLSFSHGTYPSVLSGGEPQQNMLIRSTSHSLRAAFQLQRDLELGLMASLGNRNANFAIPGGKRYFAGISLTYGISPGESLMLMNPISR